MKNLIALILICIAANSKGQTLVTITETFKTVPKGKMWVLYPDPMSKPITGEMIKNPNSAFYQEFVSDMHKFHVVGNLIDIQPGSNVSEKRLIVIDTLQRVPNANLFTYSMKVVGAVNPKMVENFLQWLDQGMGMWGMCLDRVEFKEGTQVRVSDCLKSFQLLEFPAN